MTYETLSIRIPSSDLDMLKRLAAEENRRMSDLLLLVFAHGLECHFHNIISIERKDEEIPENELKQVKLNEKLMEEDGFWRLTEEERKAKGWVPNMHRRISNWERHGDAKPVDRLIAPMVERLRALATDERGVPQTFFR